MDTRCKILDAAAAAEVARHRHASGDRVIAITGYFDVLQASHVRELRRVRKATGPGVLMAVLLRPPDPVLSDRARSEMVAGLGVIDYVVSIKDGPELEALLAGFDSGNVIRAEAAHDRLIRQLIAHVQERQTNARR